SRGRGCSSASAAAPRSARTARPARCRGRHGWEGVRSRARSCISSNSAGRHAHQSSRRRGVSDTRCTRRRWLRGPILTAETRNYRERFHGDTGRLSLSAVLLSETDQSALRFVLAAEPLAGRPLPPPSVLERLAGLVRGDVIGAAVTDPEGYVVEQVELPHGHGASGDSPGCDGPLRIGV